MRVCFVAVLVGIGGVAAAAPLKVSPELCKGAATVFEGDFEVFATKGHVVTLCASEGRCIDVDLATDTIVGSRARPKPTRARKGRDALRTTMSGDDSFDLTAKTVRTSPSGKRVGVFVQENLYMEPCVVWVDADCALISRPFPSSSPQPVTLWCSGHEPIAMPDEPDWSGPSDFALLTPTRLLLHRPDAKVVETIALPSGELVASWQSPLLDGPSAISVVHDALFPDGAAVLVMDSEGRRVVAFDPSRGTELRDWSFTPCP